MVRRNVNRRAAGEDGDSYDRRMLSTRGRRQFLVRSDDQQLEQLVRNVRAAGESLTAYLGNNREALSVYNDLRCVHLMNSLAKTSDEFRRINRRVSDVFHNLNDEAFVLNLDGRPVDWTQIDEPTTQGVEEGRPVDRTQIDEPTTQDVEEGRPVDRTQIDEPTTQGVEEDDLSDGEVTRNSERLTRLHGEVEARVRELQRAERELKSFVDNKKSRWAHSVREFLRATLTQLDDLVGEAEDRHAGSGNTGPTTAAPSMEESAAEDSSSGDPAESTTHPSMPRGNRRVSGRVCRNRGQTRENPRYLEPDSPGDL